MSDREKAKALIDQVPESEMYCVLSYLRNVVMPEDVSENVPNEETLEAFDEVDKMIQTGSGQHFIGTAEEFTKMLLEED